VAVYTLFSRTFGSNLHAHRLVNDRGGKSYTHTR